MKVKNILERMEEIRQRRGITKAHIARHCKHTITWYNDIIRGRRRIYMDDAFLVAEALDVDFVDFLDRKLNETRNSNTA